MKQKLPKRFKSLWIKALLSGKFKQGKGKLLKNPDHDKNHEAYCCIGVAAIVCGINKRTIKNKEFLNEFYLSKTNMEKIPKLLQGTNYDNEVIDKLSTYNDDGHSFKWIAAYIKRYL